MRIKYHTKAELMIYSFSVTIWVFREVVILEKGIDFFKKIYPNHRT